MNTELVLEQNLIESCIIKGWWYSVWENEVNKNETAESELLEDARHYLSKHEYDYITTLVAYGYLTENQADLTYTRGSAKRNNYLSKIADTYCIESGYITSSENDYYELAKIQNIITKEHLSILLQ